MRFVPGLSLLVATFFAAWVASAASVPAIPLGQLPPGVTPQHYRLALTIDPAKNRFSGHAEIDVVFAEPRTRMFIHGLDLKMSAVTARVNRRSIAAHYAQVDKSGVAQLVFATKIPAGKATLIFDYDAPFNTSLAGLYKVKSGGDRYAVTQFENIDARRAFPGFDEPGYKTPFDITITAPSTDKVIANTLPRRSEKLAGGLTRTVFAPTEALPTYLVAFAIGPFDIVDGGTLPPNAWRKTPLPLRGITAKGQGARIRYALSLTPKIILALENYFRIGFPFSKLDTLAIPDFASGAMENAGAITYRERYLLMSSDAPLEQRRDGLVTQAHEITHQWFGNLVTAKWWDDIWLNEAFASWMESKAAAMVMPDWEFDRETTKSGLEVMTLDESTFARKIHQPANNPDDIANAFDDITYSKGSAVLSMFESYVGEENWRAGVHDYLTTFARGNAAARDFIGIIAKHDASHVRGRAELGQSFGSFIDQPGVPLVSVGDCHKPSRYAAIAVSQSPYTPIGRKPHSQSWGIPMCVKGEGGNKICEMLNGQSADLVVGASCPKAVIPNAEGRGYYRYAFDGKGWSALIAAAPSLDAADQLTLFFNAEAALRAGRISARDFFKVLAAIAPSARWDVLGDSDAADFTGIDDALRNLRINILAPADLPAYRALVSRLFAPRLKSLGLAAKPGEAPADTLARQGFARPMVEEARDRQTIEALAAAAERFLDSNGKDTGGIAPGLMGEAVRAGFIADRPGFGDKVLAFYASSNDEFLRRSLIHSMAGSEDRAYLRKFLSMALTPRVRIGEMYFLYQFWPPDPVAREELWRWITHDFEAVKARISAQGFGDAPKILATACDTSAITDTDSFFGPKVHELEGTGRVLAQTREKIESCIAFKQAKAGEISAALHALN